MRERQTQRERERETERKKKKRRGGVIRERQRERDRNTHNATCLLGASESLAHHEEIRAALIQISGRQRGSC